VWSGVEEGCRKGPHIRRHCGPIHSPTST
jgi:hypothetical protein